MTSTTRHKRLKQKIFEVLKKAREEGTCEELSAASIVDEILDSGFRLQGLGIQRVAQICRSLAGITSRVNRINDKHLDVVENVLVYRLDSEEDYQTWRDSIATR
jgi:hypothetical protein